MNFEQMELVSGGGPTGKEFWDGVCAIWGLGRIARIFMFTTPATAALALSADIVCAAWGVSRAAQALASYVMSKKSSFLDGLFLIILAVAFIFLFFELEFVGFFWLCFLFENNLSWNSCSVY